MTLEAACDPGPGALGGLVVRDGWPRALGLLEDGSAAIDTRLAAARERGRVRVVRREGAARGAIALRESPWDAEGLGLRAVTTVDLVALAPGDEEPRVLLEALAAELDAFSLERGSGLDWLRVDSSDGALLDVLLRRGFRVVETIFSLVAPDAELGRSPPPGPGVRVREARPEDAAWLRPLAAAAFTESRFRDPQGPTGWNELVYARWIDARLAQRSPTLRFFVAELEGTPSGFLIWKVQATPGVAGLTGQVDLVATDARARGRGLGRALFDEARRASPPLSWMAADVYARNPLGLGLHQRYGLRIAASSTYLHRWLAGRGAP